MLLARRLLTKNLATGRFLLTVEYRGGWQAIDFPASGFIPVVLGILHYLNTKAVPVLQNSENH
jgi:hypothetical protein